MPRWFRLTAAIAVSVVYLVSEYAKPAQGSSSGLTLFLLFLAAVGSDLGVRWYDRRAHHADEPTTLNLNR
jgi:hypothetical protein